MNITPGYWRTVNNRKARVLCTDAPGNYPVIGYIENAVGGSAPCSWNLGGLNCINDYTPNDLTEPWDEPKRVPCGPEDFPPGSCFKWSSWDEHDCCDVVCRNALGITILVAANCSGSFLTYDVLHSRGDALRSLDGGKTWLPCYKEI